MVNYARIVFVVVMMGEWDRRKLLELIDAVNLKQRHFSSSEEHARQFSLALSDAVAAAKSVNCSAVALSKAKDRFCSLCREPAFFRCDKREVWSRDCVLTARARPGYAPVADNVFTDERVARIRVRNKARRLTALCLACEDIADCPFGLQLKEIHENFCSAQVGNDFRYCAKCHLTLTGDCPIDAAEMAEDLYEQLGRCTAKRGLSLPLILVRLDVLGL